MARHWRRSQLGFESCWLGFWVGLALGCASAAPRSAASEFSPASIQEVMGEHKLEFRSCYEQIERLGAIPSGRITFGWIVGKDGAVYSLHVESSTLSHPELGRCLMGVLQTLRFPAPARPTAVNNYPIELRRGRP